MRLMQQAHQRGRLHGFRQGLSQGLLQVRGLQAKDSGKVLRERWKALLRKGLSGQKLTLT